MPTSRKTFLRRLFRWFFATVLAWVVLTVLMVGVMRFVAPFSSAFMLERRLETWINGPPEFVIDYEWVPLSLVSPQLPVALVAAEDQKFPMHHGFDVEAIQDALADAEDGARLRGASTISQQVAKNLFLWNGRSFLRKGLEAYFTVLIELLWSKERILEVYLNIAEFGDGIYGAGAASKTYFRTSPKNLTSRQSALLAAVLPSPRKLRVDQPSAYVQRRAAWIERQVRQLGGPGYLAE